MMIATQPSVRCHDGRLLIQLPDGRCLNVDKDITPRLAAATPEQVERVRWLPYTLHWPDLDEDLTVESLQERSQ